MPHAFVGREQELAIPDLPALKGDEWAELFE
jgi:hypothetical protein